MALFFLVGKWRDEQGSTYDVSLDKLSAQSLSRCSVTITRPDGNVKQAKGVIQEKPNGSFSWNSKYAIDTVSMTNIFVKWTSLLGNRGFLWTRVEVQIADEDQGIHTVDQAYDVPSVGATNLRWVPKSDQTPVGFAISQTASSELEAHKSAPMIVSSDTKSPLERIVGVWCDDSGQKYETVLDSAEHGAESCSVTITRVDKPPLVTPGVIKLKSNGTISWSDRYVLDLDSEAHVARWVPKNGGKSFVWIRKDTEQSVTADMPANESSTYTADSMLMLTGRWCDRNGWSYDVIPDTPSQIGEASCTVRINKAGNLWNVCNGLIHLTQEGHIAWSDSHLLDGVSLSRTFVQWRSVDQDVSFAWFRNDARVSPALPANLSSDGHWSASASTVPQGLRNIVPHFCIFESMHQGVKSWSGQGDVDDDRWSEILLSLLLCVMMDGAWLKEVTASAFVGPDAVHISGAIQQLAMPQVWRQGKTRSCPATPEAWAELLWQQHGKNSPGLHWELAGPNCSISDSTTRMLACVNAMLDRSSPDAVALVFDDKHADVTYDDLRLSGIGLGTRAQDVFVLLGTSHSIGQEMDGQSSFLDCITSCFKSRLGSDRVVRLNLGPEKTSALSMPMSKVASFLSTEFSRGSLANVVAGLESRQGQWWQ